MIQYFTIKCFPFYIHIEAKIIILNYKLSSIQQRIFQLEKLSKLPAGQFKGSESTEYIDLKAKATFYSTGLYKLKEPENVNDMSACILKVRDLLIAKEYTNPVAVEICLDVSDGYWNHKFVPIKANISHRMTEIDSLPSDEQKKSLRLESDTYNGYRLDDATQKEKKVYHVFLMRVFNNRIVLLAQMQQDKRLNSLVFHTWKNVVISEERQLNNDGTYDIKVLETFDSYFLNSVGDKNYYFSFTNDPQYIPPNLNFGGGKTTSISNFF